MSPKPKNLTQTSPYPKDGAKYDETQAHIKAYGEVTLNSKGGEEGQKIEVAHTFDFPPPV